MTDWSICGTYLHPRPNEVASRPLVIAHRGGRYRGILENSREAIAIAVKSGVTHVEVDVRTTSNGIAVLSHDLPRSDVSLYSLTDALTDFPTTYFRIDLKDLRSCRTAPEIITRLHCQNRVCISSFWDYRIDGAAARLTPPVTRALGLRRGSFIALRALVGLKSALPGVAGLFIYHAHVRLTRRHVLARRIFRNLQRQGVYVHVWTVNDALDVAECLSLEVDGILTDKPQLVRAIVEGGAMSDW
jgi:glycerophosphoryl diester phosphodiesterase